MQRILAAVLRQSCTTNSRPTLSRLTAVYRRALSSDLLSLQLYIEDIVDVVDRHQTRLHLYADDTQLYDSCRLDDVSRVRSKMSSCVADVSQWCESRRLQLNTDKTEVIWFGSRANLNKLHSQEHHIQISSEIIIPTSVVRDLGVQLDSELSMKQHIRKQRRPVFFPSQSFATDSPSCRTRTDATPGPGLRHHTTGLL